MRATDISRVSPGDAIDHSAVVRETGGWHIARNLSRSVHVSAVTLSPKYQVVIPPSIRTAFKLKPGQKIEVVVYEGRITLVPVGAMRSLRGLTPGIDTVVPRDGDRV